MPCSCAPPQLFGINVIERGVGRTTGFATYPSDALGAAGANADRLTSEPMLAGR